MTGRWLALVGMAASVGLIGMVVGGCGKSSEATGPACCSAPAPTVTAPTTVAGPDGWKTETYGSVAISVPNGWVVEHGTNCPDSVGSGVLLLGYPKVLEYCREYASELSVVAVLDLPAGSDPASRAAKEKSIVVNGVPVNVGFGSPSEKQWIVPSLGVEITGTGPLASRILSTLRRSGKSGSL